MTTPDLTRWNRAGLSRVAYLGDNAATFVDRLRAAMVEHLGWTELEPDLAGATLENEDAVARVERLLAQYAGHEPREIGEELIRAFARASHVLAGHVDAYANEAWLRTATQWSTLRRLTATVGYQPQPPASASMLVGLIVGGDAAAVDVPAGLAMQGAPEGGAPAVFETLDPVASHPALNAVRAAGWDADVRSLRTGTLRWDVPVGTDPGWVGILERGTGISAHLLGTPVRDAEGLRIDPEPGWPDTPRHAARLHYKPAGIKRGRPVSGNAYYVMQTLAPGLSAPMLVKANFIDEVGSFVARIEHRPRPDLYVLEGDLGAAAHPFMVTGLSPINTNFTDGWVETGPDTATVWAWNGSEAISFECPDTSPVLSATDRTTRTGLHKSGSTITGRRFDIGGVSQVWVETGAAGQFGVILERRGEGVVFDGKPDPRMVAGAYVMAVAGTTRTALRVRSVTVSSDSYEVTFDRGAEGQPDETEFHGPMTLVAQPVDHERLDAAAVTGQFTTAPLPVAAGALIHPGRRLILRDERDLASARVATVTAVSPQAESGGMAALDIGFAEADSAFAHLRAGWTMLHANTVTAGHGEQKGALVLGSGDAERERQAFRAAVRDLSFAAHPGAEAGVAPALRFTVDGKAWDYADRVEPSVEGADVWSYTLEDDDTLTILPRRRLPTGVDNVVITHHRRGQGPGANNVAPGSIIKPMRRHARVEAVVQPFASAGGSTREPVAAMRANAAARLAANGRAVTAADYARLVRRHASVWDARALEGLIDGRGGVDVVVWPAGGVSAILYDTPPKLAGTLGEDLAAFIRARGQPGVRFMVRPAVYNFAAINANVRVDVARNDPRAVAAAVRAALMANFGDPVRRIGQDIHIGEAIGVVERVPGVRTSTLEIGAWVTERQDYYPDGSVRAIRAAADEVVAVPVDSFVTVTWEAAHD
ncbi:MAG: hypothetical protein V4574_06120 [Pseudomonadota bacterium]